MCLYVGNRVALVAKKDITVYKYLNKNGDSYTTACRETPINLNEVLKPDTETENPQRECYNKYCIDGGAIHACLTTIDSGFNCYCVKAIIKAGTTYYVQDDFMQVAAKELFITDEEVTDNVTTPDMKSICEDYMNAVLQDDKYINKDGVHIGDFCLSNKTYVNPLTAFDHDDAIGIVAYFDDNDNPVVLALDEEYLPWLTQYSMKNKVCSDISGSNTIKDFNGKKHTYDIATSKDYDPEKFKAVAYCTKYKTKGTKEGDWYLGAIGECIKVAQNMGILNASMLYAECGETIKMNWMWSSSEVTWGGSSYAWICNLDDGICYGYCGDRDGKDEVRPFSAFINGAKA